MKVSLPPAVVGTKETLFVCEVEFPVATAERTIEVTTTGGIEALDLSGTGRGGTYQVPVGVERLHVPMRVVQDGGGDAAVHVACLQGPEAGETLDEALRIEGPVGAVGGAAGSGKKLAVIGGIAALVLLGVLLGPKLFRGSGVPDVVGKFHNDAYDALTAAGYQPHAVYEPAKTPEEAGKVLRQIPEADASLAKGGEVEIVVGQPQDMLKSVPGLVGEDAATAEEAITAAGFQPMIQYRDVADEAFVGKVVEQSPQEGRLAPGQQVELFVGRAAETVAMAPEAPPEAPEAPGPAVPPVPEATTPPGPEAPVPPVPEATTPEAPTPPAPEATTPQPEPSRTGLRTVPDLRGLARAVAEKQVRDAGFVPIATIEPASAGVRKDSVVRQVPEPGEKAEKGRSVLLTIAGESEPEAPRPTATHPETTHPETTHPETTHPEATHPEATHPEAPHPEATHPEATHPETTTPPPTSTQEGRVPRVVGLSRILAEGRIRKAGFTTTVVLEATADTPDGTVLSQEPGPDVPHLAGQVVKITVSQTPPEAQLPVPDVGGLERAKAEIALRDAGFLVRVRHAAAVRPQDVGCVIAQTPPGGTMGGRRTWVDITVGGAGGPTPIAPTPVTRAPGESGTLGAPPVPEGTVRRPAPTPTGATASRPAVRLPPRDAPKTATVPSVQGMGAREAIVAVLSAGMLPIVEVDRSAQVAAGTVATQRPGGSTPALPGDLVRLSVAVGPGLGERSVDLPTVIGMGVDGARRLYSGTRVGVQVLEVSVPGHPYAGTGLVAAQYPVSSVPLSQAGTVTLWVVR